MNARELRDKLNEFIEEYGQNIDVQIDLKCQDEAHINLEITGIEVQNDAILLEC